MEYLDSTHPFIIGSAAYQILDPCVDYRLDNINVVTVQGMRSQWVKAMLQLGCIEDVTRLIIRVNFEEYIDTYDTFLSPKGVTITITVASGNSITPLILCGDTTLESVAVGSHFAYSFYPDLLEDGLSIPLNDGMPFMQNKVNSLNLRSEFHIDNSRWSNPCGMSCPMLWRRTQGAHDPVQGCKLLGHIEIHSSYQQQENTIQYGEKRQHAKWGYGSGERCRTFRPHLSGIITDIKTSTKDLGYGLNDYPTIVLGYPNVEHDMVSGNFYNQLVSLREQIYKDVEETDLPTSTIFPWTPLETDTIELHLFNNGVVCTNSVSNQNVWSKHVYKVKGVKLDEGPGRSEVFSETSSVISGGWHPGLIQKGALVVGEVELQQIDHIWKELFMMFYNVIAHQVVVLAHNVDIIEGVKHDL
ncbi:hypothetical protein F5876DRAFT_82699 [Lentinula aff. lateritia]|uniref:Uncharacterized protein n=1 Tax=Lentinula aff. lateritia TaxID=2804960 RepID=A0ACC1TJE9_9AGAR|nr:hypothetical protein F5876DRAFT_82699 [Lentinula aff. lateritia]